MEPLILRSDSQSVSLVVKEVSEHNPAEGHEPTAAQFQRRATYRPRCARKGLGDIQTAVAGRHGKRFRAACRSFLKAPPSSRLAHGALHFGRHTCPHAILPKLRLNSLNAPAVSERPDPTTAASALHWVTHWGL